MLQKNIYMTKTVILNASGKNVQIKLSIRPIGVN